MCQLKYIYFVKKHTHTIYIIILGKKSNEIIKLPNNQVLDQNANTRRNDRNGSG